MKLNRRYKRNLKENLTFYIASIVLTCLALFLFFLYDIAGEGIRQYGVDFFASQNLEDAQFMTVQTISDEEIKELESKYDITLEKQSYINVKEDDLTIRVFTMTDKIDLPEITVGKMYSNDDEIIISEGYANENHISVGDTISLNNQDYTITGFFLRPDYLYMIENMNDTYKNVTTFVLAYVDVQAFESLGNSNSIYYLKSNDDFDEVNFRKEINKNYTTLSYVKAENNKRITMVDDQAVMFIEIAYLCLVLIALVTVALIAIITKRKVQSDQKIIGTLTALGYRKKELMLHYLWMAVIPGLLGSILSCALAYIFASPYGNIGLADYEPMRCTFTLNPVAMIAGLILPALFYGLSSVITCHKLLKNDTVLLLNANVDGNKKTKKVFVNKKQKLSIKYSLRSLLSNPGRSFVLFLGIFLGTLCVAMTFICIDSMDYFPTAYKKQMGNFEAEYMLKQYSNEPIEDVDTVLIKTYEKGDYNFQILGVDEDISTITTKTSDGKADFDSGWYITSYLSHLYDIDTGDTFTFVDPATYEEYSVKVKGIIETDMQGWLVSNKENVAEITGADPTYYNGIISDHLLDLDSSEVSKTITSDSIQDMMDNMMSAMNDIIYAIAIIGAIICIASISVVINMIVNENRNNISMLKVLGYRNQEINRMILNANHIILPISMLISIVVTYYAMELYFIYSAGSDGVICPVAYYPKSIIITVAIVSASYMISLYLNRRKVDKVDMIESLKDNRE